jgi:Rrf2 family transcriptional regulator, cysteine metabolism repressor
MGGIPVQWLMNISVKGQYALHALIDLAVQKPGQPVKIADIARRQKIPQKFLELILATLKQGGFVESRRGAEGGYLLARAADSLTVGDVLRFVEGQHRSSRPERKRSRRQPDDPFSDLWERVDCAESEILDKTTFGDILREWKEKQNKYVMNWEI